MGRKNQNAKATTSKAKKVAPAKGKPAKKATKHVPRRSSSQFTPLEATAARALGTRPTTIEVVVVKGNEQHLVRLDGKLVGRCNSASAARRLRAKTEKAGAYALTPAKRSALVKRYEKARG